MGDCVGFCFVCVTALLVISISTMNALTAALADLDKIPELMLSIEQQSSVCEPINEEVKADILKLTELSKGWEETARVGIETQCTEIERQMVAHQDAVYVTPKPFHFLSTFEKNYSELCDGKINKLFPRAIEYGTIEEIEFLLLCDNFNPDESFPEYEFPFEDSTVVAVIASQSYHLILPILSLLLKDPRISRLDGGLECAVHQNYTEIVKLLLDDGRCDPTSAGSYKLLKDAIDTIDLNKNEIVDLFLQDARIDLSTTIPGVIYHVEDHSKMIGNHLLEIAINARNAVIVKTLLSKLGDTMNQSRFYNVMLGRAASVGSLEIVDVLLQDTRVDPWYFNNESLAEATIGKDLDVVKRLLREQEQRIITKAFHSPEFKRGLIYQRYCKAKQFVERLDK
jgi:hypothetical protein